jgi:hypothetical protein
MRIPHTLRRTLLLFIIAGCASSQPRTAPEDIAVFLANQLPTCSVEQLGEVSTSAAIRGGRSAAEPEIRRLLVRAASRRGADAIFDIQVSADPVAISVPGGTRPIPTDLPAATWRGTAKALRYTDSDCRH